MFDSSFDTALSDAIALHAQWTATLSRRLTTGQCDVSPDPLMQYDCCAFGKWLAGPHIDDAVRARIPWQVTNRLHREYHETLSEIARLAKDDPAAARVLFDTVYHERSTRLETALRLWLSELREDALDCDGLA